MTNYHTIPAANRYRKMWEALYADGVARTAPPAEIVEAMRRDYPDQTGEPIGLVLCPFTWDAVIA